MTAPPPTAAGRPFPLLSDEECWRRLPAARAGQGSRLPSWARITAGEVPRTTAALLRLDAAQRLDGPIEPRLRAAMRRVAALANGCEYAAATAAADARRTGLGEALLRAVDDDAFAGWPAAERRALAFARAMTRASDAVTDAEFAALVADFGPRSAASMVLLLAHANFQDRLLICLGAPIEPDGALPPSEARFEPSAFVSRTTPPPAPRPAEEPAGETVVLLDEGWSGLPYDALQDRLESQRGKPTRLPIPEWESFAAALPPGLFDRPSGIVWYRICFGYAPELAVPFEYFMRTAGAETSGLWDRVFGQSLFWVTTRTVVCPYCMGHCEMNWEVAGLTAAEIADRSRRLAAGDWSSFPAAHQRAFAFARKLGATPWAVSADDVEGLLSALGPDRGFVAMLHACRHHYMTRISNGFQLRLERENVFYDYYAARRPAAAAK